MPHRRDHNHCDGELFRDDSGHPLSESRIKTQNELKSDSALTCKRLGIETLELWDLELATARWPLLSLSACVAASGASPFRVCCVCPGLHCQRAPPHSKPPRQQGWRSARRRCDGRTAEYISPSLCSTGLATLPTGSLGVKVRQAELAA